VAVGVAVAVAVAVAVVGGMLDGNSEDFTTLAVPAPPACF